MKSIAVFCGANNGNNPVYAAAAKAFGELLARGSITLVFGGGKVGLKPSETTADSRASDGMAHARPPVPRL